MPGLCAVKLAPGLRHSLAQNLSTKTGEPAKLIVLEDWASYSDAIMQVMLSYQNEWFPSRKGRNIR